MEFHKRHLMMEEDNIVWVSSLSKNYFTALSIYSIDKDQKTAELGNARRRKG
jgi:hypothetical protein